MRLRISLVICLLKSSEPFEISDSNLSTYTEVQSLMRPAVKDKVLHFWTQRSMGYRNLKQISWPAVAPDEDITMYHCHGLSNSLIIVSVQLIDFTLSQAFRSAVHAKCAFQIRHGPKSCQVGLSISGPQNRDITGRPCTNQSHSLQRCLQNATCLG